MDFTLCYCGACGCQVVFFSCWLWCEELCNNSCSKHSFSHFLKSWIKGFDTSLPGLWSIVSMKASGKLCESQRGHAPYGEALLHGRWWCHQSPIVYALFKLQREYWSAWKTIQLNAAVRKRTLRGRYSTLCSLTNPAKTCGHEQTSSWHSGHAELIWKISLVVGVHNDSNEDSSKASDGDYQMRNLHFLLSDKGRRLLVQMDFWKALKFPAKQHL